MPGDASLNRIARAAVVVLLVSIVGAVGAVAPVAASARVPKVVLIVGPAGDVTPTYRRLADQAAAEAVAAGAQVVKVYSPNATWDAVRAAITGASIVVYLGHGNGWPSRYRDALYPPTQDGFGLNPVAGVDDAAHQYFGEASVRKLHLAPSAVVVLSHLCYASGNTEPGLAEGTRAQAIQRVDNYAAGFLRAGAAAVVAEAHMGPAYYVGALLRGRVSIESTWRTAPSAKGNTFGVASRRSPGFVERLDPDGTSGGYYRSLVSRGVTARQLRAGSTGTVGSTGTGGLTTLGTAAEPSLAGHGLSFGEPAFASLPIAATGTKVTLPLTAGNAGQIPAKARAGVRWDPILVEQPSAPATGPVASPQPTPQATPSAAPAQATLPTPAGVPSPAPPSLPAPGSSPAPASLPAPGSSPAPAGVPLPTQTGVPSPAPTPPPDPPAVDLVQPERLGQVVDVVPAVRTSAGLTIQVSYPDAPGLYRLVVTLHAPSGMAYDAATQALLVPVIVRVGGPVAVAYGAPSSLAVPAGSSSRIAVRVVNAGSERWEDVAPEAPAAMAERPWIDPSAVRPLRLVATWVSVEGLAVPAARTVALGEAVAAPGGSTTVLVPLAAPPHPGSYLLLLDVNSPTHGPLSALGSPPAIIRVTVALAPAPTPIPTPIPTAAPTPIPTSTPTSIAAHLPD